MTNPVQYSASDIGRTDIDEGLRKHFMRVYQYMVAGLGLTGFVAWYIGTDAQLFAALQPYMLFLGIGLFAAPFIMSFAANRLSFGAMQVFFFGYAAAMGAVVSLYVVMYTQESIFKAFFMASALFVGVSIYGYTTKKNLSGWAPMLGAGMIAIIVASLLNVFIFQSSMMSMIMDALVIALSAGIAAWSTQEIRDQYYMGGGEQMAGKLSILGALTLYINFLNMFLAILRLFGDRR
jgi:uncharacterized protein